METTAIPIAFLAGILSLLSPCVLPMVPTVASSALRASKLGLLALAAGLSIAFALAGSILTFVFLNLGIDPGILRHVSAGFLLIMGLVLVVPYLNDKLTLLLSRLVASAPNMHIEGDGLFTQFLVGSSLGLVWLPCVGPTLGTAIALASTGESLGMAFIVMLSFGIGTALPLIGLGYFAQRSLSGLLSKGMLVKKLMGFSLILLALVLMTNADRAIERWAINHIPSWSYSL